MAQGEFIEGQSGAHAGYHPMKGPLMTQPLKGLTDTDPYREGITTAAIPARLEPTLAERLQRARAPVTAPRR